MNHCFEVCILGLDEAYKLTASLLTKTMEEAQTIADVFPKCIRVKALPCYGPEGYVYFCVALGSTAGNAKNEEGLKRIAAFIEHCERLGYSYEVNTVRYRNTCDTTIKDLLESEKAI